MPDRNTVLGMRAEVDREYTVEDSRSILAHNAHAMAVRYVEATYGGTRYVVVVSRMPHGALEGGPVLVTVLHPWPGAKVMADRGYLDITYVREHFRDPRGRGADVDYYALTLTIRHALDRTDT